MLDSFAGPIEITGTDIAMALLFFFGILLAYTCFLAGIYFITYKVLMNKLDDKVRARTYASITILTVFAVTFFLISN